MTVEDPADRADLADPADRRLVEVTAELAAIARAAAAGLLVLARGPQPEAQRVAEQIRAAWPPVPIDLTIVTQRTERTERTDREPDVVVDCRDAAWPILRYVRPPLPWSARSRLRETQAFFSVRAGVWDTKFGDDLPAYRAAAIEASFRSGGRVADIGCGTGRAIPALRAAVGPGGGVLALDVTPEMLAQLRRCGRDHGASLVLGDAARLPLADASLDGIFAAGLVSHLHDPEPGLAELARVTRGGGRLALFHPSGRAVLAARHGRTLSPDESPSPGRLGPTLAGAGWQLIRYDDAPDRFFALAVRLGGTDA
jgi:SAM-dependent methyltransferase